MAEEEEKKARVFEARARARDLQRWSVEERERLGRRFRERKRVGLYRKRERRSFSESRVIIERVSQSPPLPVHSSPHNQYSIEHRLSPIK